MARSVLFAALPQLTLLVSLNEDTIVETFSLRRRGGGGRDEKRRGRSDIGARIEKKIFIFIFSWGINTDVAPTLSTKNT